MAVIQANFIPQGQLLKPLVDCVSIQPGETIYDGAAGSCGFLIEAFEDIKENYKGKLSTEQWRFFARRCIIWQRKNPTGLHHGHDEHDSAWH